MKRFKYSVLIQWSEEDQKYIASLPEWGPYAHTHGTSYEEAARNAEEVLELLLEGETNPPAPALFPTEEPASTEA
jgi:predicted RNase H-like HicB family nuclease